MRNKKILIFTIIFVLSISCISVSASGSYLSDTDTESNDDYTNQGRTYAIPDDEEYNGVTLYFCDTSGYTFAYDPEVDRLTVIYTDYEDGVKCQTHEGEATNANAVGADHRHYPDSSDTVRIDVYGSHRTYDDSYGDLWKLHVNGNRRACQWRPFKAPLILPLLPNRQANRWPLQPFSL